MTYVTHDINTHHMRDMTEVRHDMDGQHMRVSAMVVFNLPVRIETIRTLNQTKV